MRTVGAILLVLFIVPALICAIIPQSECQAFAFDITINGEPINVYIGKLEDRVAELESRLDNLIAGCCGLERCNIKAIGLDYSLDVNQFVCRDDTLWVRAHFMGVTALCQRCNRKDPMVKWR